MPPLQTPGGPVLAIGGGKTRILSRTPHGVVQVAEFNMELTPDDAVELLDAVMRVLDRVTNRPRVTAQPPAARPPTNGVSPRPSRQVSRRSDAGTVQEGVEAIYAWLVDHPDSSSLDVVESLGLPYSTVAYRLSSLVRVGRVAVVATTKEPTRGRGNLNIYRVVSDNGSGGDVGPTDPNPSGRLQPTRPDPDAR